jgi:hypothetical protein
MKTYFNDVVLRQLLSYTYHSDLGGHFVKQKKISSSDFQNRDTYRLLEYSDYYNIETRNIHSSMLSLVYTHSLTPQSHQLALCQAPRIARATFSP